MLSNTRPKSRAQSRTVRRGGLFGLGLAVVAGSVIGVTALSQAAPGADVSAAGANTDQAPSALSTSASADDSLRVESAAQRSFDRKNIGTRTWTKRPTKTRTSSSTSTTTSATAAPSTATSTSATATSSTTTVTSTTTTAPSTSAPRAWPGADNTGVPSGTTLTKYTGPCTITSAQTISGVDASACSAILIKAKGVVITKSLLPRVDATDSGGSVTLSDSTVKAGAWSDGAIWGYNITASRVNVTGGQHSVHCAGNCTVTDSWLHDQYNPAGQSYHNNAFITNGGSNMVLRGNTLHCTATLNSTDGGCTADVSLFGDFDPVTDVTVERNLLKANNSSISYCAYGGYQPSKAYPVATGIKYIDNVFERGANGKCGVYGPVTSFQSTASGNIWSGNTFDDGVAIRP